MQPEAIRIFSQWGYRVSNRGLGGRSECQWTAAGALWVGGAGRTCGAQATGPTHYGAGLLRLHVDLWCPLQPRDGGGRARLLSNLRLDFQPLSPGRGGGGQQYLLADRVRVGGRG